MASLYYDHGGIQLWHGDCRDVLPSLHVDCCITDPVWPNAHPDLEGAADPLGLFVSCLQVLPAVKRLCVWLGCQSDPRFLTAVPAELEFLRMCYLRRAVPSYNGRCLVSGDVLYAFGEWPPASKGHMVLPGECSVTSNSRKRMKHPCARNEAHAKWVVKWWSADGETILDPFCGTGTTMRAAKDAGRSGVGIEIREEYLEIAARRLDQECFAFEV